MKSKRKAGWMVLGLLALGCSEDAQPAECLLPETPRFDFTKVVLDSKRSNAQCPEIAPSQLDTDALSDQQVCEHAIVDCVIELACDYEGLSIRGRMVESEAGLEGRFDIETPVTCLYAVQAKWKEAEGG